LKKITVIKNVSCATVVSSSVPFIGWATINPLLHELPNFRTMFYTWKILFLTSLYIEILLDMVDKKGDQEMGIRTLPVVFGERGSWICLTGILTAGYTHLYGSGLPIPSLVVTAVPMYLNLLYIYWSQFSRDAIKATFKYTTVIMVLYFVTLLV
jgi:4-hydroxybenzoate polyprenyltransferase